MLFGARIGRRVRDSGRPANREIIIAHFVCVCLLVLAINWALQVSLATIIINNFFLARIAARRRRMSI